MIDLFRSSFIWGSSMFFWSVVLYLTAHWLKEKNNGSLIRIVIEFLQGILLTYLTDFQSSGRCLQVEVPIPRSFFPSLKEIERRRSSVLNTLLWNPLNDLNYCQVKPLAWRNNHPLQLEHREHSLLSYKLQCCWYSWERVDRATSLGPALQRSLLPLLPH